MENGRYSDNLETAQKNYPTLRRTIELAREFDINIVWHYAKFTKKGKVCQHLFMTKDKKTGEKEWHRNQDLLTWLRNCKALRDNKF